MEEQNIFEIIKSFVFLAKRNGIQELAIDDMNNNFKKMKEMDKYKDLLAKCHFINDISPDILAYIVTNANNGQIVFQENSYSFYISTKYDEIEKFLSTVNFDTKKLICSMLNNYVKMNTDKEMQKQKMLATK